MTAAHIKTLIEKLQAMESHRLIAPAITLLLKQSEVMLLDLLPLKESEERRLIGCAPMSDRWHELHR